MWRQPVYVVIADDIVLLASTKHNLQSMLNELSDLVRKRMKVNREKS